MGADHLSPPGIGTDTQCHRSSSIYVIEPSLGIILDNKNGRLFPKSTFAYSFYDLPQGQVVIGYGSPWGGKTFPRTDCMIVGQQHDGKIGGNHQFVRIPQAL